MNITRLWPRCSALCHRRGYQHIVGGFLITDRMLKMFKASGPKKHESAPEQSASSGNDLSDRSHAVHFVVEWLSSPASARRGVRAGEIGMLLAVVGTLLHHGIVDYTWIAIALVLGTVIGVPLGLCK